MGTPMTVEETFSYLSKQFGSFKHKAVKRTATDKR